MTAMKKQKSARLSLTKEQLKRLTVDELVKIKFTDDEKALWSEIRRERDQEREQRSARLAIEERPILSDLHEIGWDIESVWNLVNIPNNYAEAVPILLKHLLLPYSDRTRAGIARALAVREASQAWRILVSEYRNAPMGTGIVAPGDTEELRLGVKDGLACALSVAVTDETLPELIALAKDPSHGESRILLLSALRKSKNPIAKKAIEELAFDPELAKEIAAWSSKKAKGRAH
ncbi:MAG TPA: hypothetical protein VFH31_02005 [Pyrinomonadaceae bacterium]|nr:hypothetical protein [Pyrinomonadaceae bacterium]